MYLLTAVSHSIRRLEAWLQAWSFSSISSKAVLASASICIAFISKNWHHVTLASSTYYFLMATLFGSLYSLIALLILVLRPYDDHSATKWRFVSGNMIVAIAAAGCGIVFTVNIVYLYQSQSSFIYTNLRPSAYIVGMVSHSRPHLDLWQITTWPHSCIIISLGLGISGSHFIGSQRIPVVACGIIEFF